MPRDHHRGFCVNCGDAFRGTGQFCSDCRPARRRAAAVLKKFATPRAPAAQPTAVCRFCDSPVTWENVGRLLRRLAEGQVESLYYCTSCRSTLEFASWVQEK